MTANLLDLAKGYLTNEVVGKAASMLGEDQSTTQSAFNHILPALMGTMAGKADSKSGASDLFGMVTRPEFGGGLLNNLGDLFSNSETTNNTLNLGGTLLNSLLGNKTNGLIDMVSSAAGMKSNSTSSLMKLALPILLSVVGKKVKSEGLGLDGFMNLLQGQKEYVKQAAPAGFMDKIAGTLGLAGLGSSVSKAVDNTGDRVKRTADRVERKVEHSTTGGNNNGGGGFGRFLPWLLIIGALLLAWWLFRTCQDDVKKGVDATVDKTGQVYDSTKNAVQDGANNIYSFFDGKKPTGYYDEATNRYVYEVGDLIELDLPNGEKVSVAENGGEHTLYRLINSNRFKVFEDSSRGWFTLDGVNFVTGSADLDGESNTKLENIAAILKAYPDVNIKLGGYTDNVGGQDVNQPLSQSRAEAAMAKIVSSGIAAERLGAEGFGQEHPICPANDTDACKAQNRRVDARVTAK